MFALKLKASLLHLLISALVVGSFVGFALWVWYPSPFLQISGLVNILLILVTVDLVLGPLLTLVIYKPDKAHLKLDLLCIGLVQLTALGYGIYTIYQGHPVYTVYAVDRFTLITAQEAQPERARYAEYQVSKLGSPVLTYAKKPSDPKLLEKLIFATIAGEPDIDARPEYYEPFDAYRQEILKKGIPVAQLTAKLDNRKKLAEFLTAQQKAEEQYAFFPLSGKEKDVIWVWDRELAKPAGMLDINPWKLGANVATVTK